jgi:hypothetical protein
MPISTSSFGDERDNVYGQYDQEEMYAQETLDFPGLTPALAETLLKRLGGGVAEKHVLLEGIGWKATILPNPTGLAIQFDAHDELLDDLIRRFQEMADRANMSQSNA